MNYSPVIHAIQNPEDPSNHYYVMREDLLPFSMGGNKVRIAAEFFRDMREQGCDVMIAYGNVRSNLCRVIANQCRREGIPCFIISSHSPGEEDHPETANSRMMELLGAHLVPCLNTEVAVTVEELFSSLRREGHRPYYIYGNCFGTGNEGTPALAYAHTYADIRSLASRMDLSFDYIFHASGTGATQAGLTCGHILAGDHTKVMGVLISSRTYERASSLILDAMKSAMEKLDHPWDPAWESEMHLIGDYTAGGYGQFNEEILDVIRKQFCINGLPLDPVYTGKAFWGMQSWLTGHAVQSKNILFIHTGGTPLFYDHLPLIS